MNSVLKTHANIWAWSEYSYSAYNFGCKAVHFLGGWQKKNYFAALKIFQKILVILNGFNQHVWKEKYIELTNPYFSGN